MRIVAAIVVCTLMAMGQANPVIRNDAGTPTITPVIKSYTVAGLPTPQAGMRAEVTDGASATDCTTGGGSVRVACRYNGTAWVAEGGGGGGKPVYSFAAASTSVTAVAFTVYLITATAVTVTLPASPEVGDQVVVMSTSFTNGVIARNGKLIMGLSEDLTIDVANQSVTLIFLGDTHGWRII